VGAYAGDLTGVLADWAAGSGARVVAIDAVPQERLGRQEALLRRLLESSAFALAERLSRLRRRAGVAPGQSVVSKDEVRRVLDDA
jgi:hypothetical protein